MAATSDFEGCMTHGPWGGSNGNKWVYKPRGFTKKMNIVVGHTGYVVSLSFLTNCDNGEVQTSVFGGTDGYHKDTICIDYPSEFLMSISGTYVACPDTFLRSICFTTNLKLYGPYGSESEKATIFSYDVNGEVIVGFHGRCTSKSISAFGVYSMPKSLALAPNPTFNASNIMDELCSSMSRIAMPRDAGPWGASGGKQWDDGFFSTIKEIHVHLGELNVIYAVQSEYLKSEGKFVMSQIHGATHGSKIEVVSLDWEDEYLTAISGFYGPIEGYKGLEAITSISFHTNKNVHGPYGEESVVGHVYFSSTASPGKIAGFHGRCNGFLSAIGVHMEYF